MKTKNAKKMGMSTNFRHEDHLMVVKLGIDGRGYDCPRVLELSKVAKSDEEKAFICVECPEDIYPECWLDTHGREKI